MARSKVAGIDEAGTPNEKQLDELVADLHLYFRMTHGPDHDLGPGSVDADLSDAIAIELRTLWAAWKGGILQSYIRTAQGSALDALVKILEVERKLAAYATGTVTFSRTAAAPAGGITIPAGTVVQTAGGIRFTTNANATIAEGDTSVDAAITATLAGANNNVGASTITIIVSAVVGVDSVTNAAPTSGGFDKESDDSLRARALTNPAVRGCGTADAIRSNLLEVDSVTAATVIVNDEDDTTADDTFFDGTQTGTASESITTTKKIAQLFTVPAGGKWVQNISFTVTPTGATVTARIETVSATNPTGTLADSHLTKTGISPNDGTATPMKFDRPGFLAAGTYAVVLFPTAGSFTLDGGTGGTADQVKVDSGSGYGNSANIENSSIDVTAGVPPHSVHAYVLGGSAADITQMLWDRTAGGIRTWGDQSDTVTDKSGIAQTVRFSRPTQETIYFDVTIVTDDEWDATNGPNAVRDAIVQLVGGTDTQGTFHAGLDVGADVQRADIIAAIKAVAGVDNITLSSLKMDTVDPPVSTSGDIAIANTKLARAETASNIDITAS